MNHEDLPPSMCQRCIDRTYCILDPLPRLAAVASVYEVKQLQCIFRHKSTYAARPLLGTGGMQRHDRTLDP